MIFDYYFTGVLPPLTKISPDFMTGPEPVKNLLKLLDSKPQESEAMRRPGPLKPSSRGLSLFSKDLPFPRQQALARCALLRLGQWALDCRDFAAPRRQHLGRQLPILVQNARLCNSVQRGRRPETRWGYRMTR